jgi:hypothetical protein
MGLLLSISLGISHMEVYFARYFHLCAFIRPTTLQGVSHVVLSMQMPFDQYMDEDVLN